MNLQSPARPGVPLPANTVNHWLDWDSPGFFLWVASKTGEIRFVSSNVKRVTGYIAEELVAAGRPARLALIHPDDQSLYVAQFRAMWDVGTPMDVEYRFKAADSRWLWLRCRAALVINAEGVAEAQAMVMDVTDRRQALEELKEARAAAEAANAAKSMFLATMSHEIRTPMTAILGYTELLMTSEAPQEKQRLQWTQTIESSGRRLMDILDDVLDLTRIEEGHMPVQPELFSPVELAFEVKNLFIAQFTRKQLQANVCIAEGVGDRLRGDAAKIRQILINLVSNAVKFTDRGSVTITVRREKAAERLCFDITDTGPGISAEEQAMLFKPFGQTSSAAKRGGTGLGLFISQKLAKLLDGDLTLTSVVGQGSTLSVGLPYEVAEAVKDLRNAVLRVQESTRGRVLVVDDVKAMRTVAQNYLTSAGFNVDCAENGNDAIRQITSLSSTDRPFDLVLMDVEMPVLDGFAATATLRAKGYSRPIVAYTANTRAEDLQACLRAGYDGVVMKPISAKTFPKLIQSYVERTLPRAA